MRSTLIRFTSSKYVDSYMTGNLWLSSMWIFWDFLDDKLRQEDIQSGRITQEQLESAIEKGRRMQNDFSEGVIAQIPRDRIPYITKDFDDRVIHDIRFRLSAYKYCNLLCFFRIDAEDDGYDLLKSGKHPRIIQLPDKTMDSFGDMVVVIKDEEEFKKRVLDAVLKTGGQCIMGDIRYHRLEDRIDSTTMNNHSVTIISSKAYINKDKDWLTEDGSWKLSDLEGLDDIYWRGCLDKYDMYSFQKEWRICWLPKELDYKDRILPVGRLDDIIDIVETSNIRKYLLNKYKGYMPGIVGSIRKTVCGTESYRAFCDRMKSIDGLGDYILEIV